MTWSEVHEDTLIIVGIDASSAATIEVWVLEFKRSRESLEVDPRVGCP
jgi:hypothetical protein